MSEPAWTYPVPDQSQPPVVSILIPSHRPEFLAEAIASVAAQTVPETSYELLVNHSADWHGQKVNNLARIARGKYLCVLCEDDRIAPTFLEKCLDAARGNFDLIYTDIQFFGDRTDVYQLPSFGLNTFRHATCPWMTALVKKTLWDEIGGHDPGVVLIDTVFWIECAKRGAEAAHIREPLFEARQHGGNCSKTMDMNAAALQVQARYPELFPSAYLGPTAPGQVAPDVRPVTPVFHKPARWQEPARA